MPHLDLAFQPKQETFLRWVEATGPDVPTILGFGGARGGAKSGTVRRVMLHRRLVSKPGTKGAIVRRVFGDLKENHIDPLLSEFPDLRPYYRVGDHELRLPNGSVISFAYAETEAEVKRKFWGPEWMDIFVDQAEQFNESELITMKTANRTPGVAPGTCKYGLFFNPGGVGTEALRRWFSTRAFLDNERPADYQFLQAYGWDNFVWFESLEMTEREFYALPSDQRFAIFVNQTQYGRELNALPKALRAGHLLGSFESFEGQYFAGVWSPEFCVLTTTQEAALVQPWWTRWIAQDWGFGDHASTGWYASGRVAPDHWERIFGGKSEWPIEVVVRYREHIINARAEADLAGDIVNMTPQWERSLIQRFFLSQDAFGQRAKQTGGHTVGDQFARVMRQGGMPAPEPPYQDRVTGWRFMYGCLRQTELRGTNFDAARAKESPVFFLGPNCPQAISHIPLAVRDDKNLEDVMRVAGALWEDICDECRYGLLSMLGPKAQAPREVRAQEVYNSYDDMTSRAMAMRQFAAREDQRRAPRSRFR